MAEEAIPDQVRAFIATYIESVGQLEILLLLHAQSQRHWTSDDVAKELRVDPQWAANEMARLVGAGLLHSSFASPPTFHYAPKSPEIDAAVAGLAHEYATRRVTVIGLIFSKPIDKIRSFADAFRIRKEKTDG